MKKILLYLILLISLISCNHKNDFTKAVSKSSESIVMVHCFQIKYDVFHHPDSVVMNYGSGVVIKKNGYIITCNHITQNTDSIIVIDRDDTLGARLVSYNKDLDMSILKVNKKLEPIKITNSNNVKVGQNVLCLGYPLQIGLVANGGIVSSRIKGNVINSEHIVNYIQSDAVMNIGNSGGALVNDEGELIGINDMMITHTGYYIGYSFAIPINDIMEYADKIIKNDK